MTNCITQVKCEFYLSLKKVLLFAFITCKVMSQSLILSSLNYDVEISSRLAETEVRATFQNKGRFESSETLQLLLPETVLISTLYIETKLQNYTSSIVKKKSVNKEDPKNSDTNVIRLNKRTARAQKLEIDARLIPGEKFTVTLGFTDLLRRKRGLYHVILYLPQTKSQDVDLDINIRMMGEMKTLTFLKSDGKEQPLRTIKRGTADIYSSNERELKMKYKRNIHSRFPFTSVTHHNPTLGVSSTGSPTLHLSFHPSTMPRLFLADSAFVLSFDVERFSDGGNVQIQNGFFVHFLSPEGLPKLPVHTVFVLDISGSMDESGKLLNLKMAMETTLQRLQKEDSFEVFVFSTNVKSLGIYKGSSVDIARSISKIKRLRAYGGTNINDALLDSVYGANDFEQMEGVKQIVFLTDGNRTVGEMDANVIREEVREANVDKVPIYALAFGNDADMKFLRQMSRENRGFARKIRSTGRPADQLESFYEEISTPLLTGLHVTYPSDEVEEESLVKLRQDSFYSGDEVVLAGKLREKTSSLTPNVTANGAKGRIQLKVSRKDILEASPSNKTGVVERIWAYLSVQDLLLAQELIDDENVRAELRARALEIALMYNFVTRLTSLVIEELTNVTSPLSNENETFYPSHLGLPDSVREEIAKGLTLVSPEDFAATLPNELQVDNDPHFVVEVSGLALPLCFDLHGQPGDVLNLVRDDVSGLIVNAEVSAAIGRPGATYFTRFFISLKRLNLTITTNSIAVNCFLGESENEVSEIWHDTDFDQKRKKRIRRRKHFVKSYKRHNKRRRKRLRREVFRHKYRHKHFLSDEDLDGGGDDDDDEDGNSNLQRMIKPTNQNYSPVIDAYLEKDRDREMMHMRHKQIKIRPNFSDLNLSWEEYRKYIKEFQRKGFINHFLYTYPIDKVNSLVIRSSFLIAPPKEVPKKSSNFIRTECNKEFTWEHVTQRRYDDVVLTVRGRRKRKRLDVVVNDVNLHVVITNTRNRNGQAFLGFYIQEQKILSPNTTGVIGQFVYKSVGTIGNYPELFSDPGSQENRTIPLVVIHLPQAGNKRSRVTRVAAIVSKRRSLLHRDRVLCLHVKRHGKGLLAKKSRAYILPNLCS